MPAFAPLTQNSNTIVTMVANTPQALTVPPGATAARIVHSLATPVFVDFPTVATPTTNPGGLPVLANLPYVATIRNGYPTLGVVSATAGTIYVTFGTGDYSE